MLKSKYSIRDLCRTLKCSKSGYYDWIVLGRPEIKKFDKHTTRCDYNEKEVEAYFDLN